MQNIDKLYQRFLAQECSPEEASLLLEYFATDEGKIQVAKLVEQEINREMAADIDDFEINQSVKKNRNLLSNIILPQHKLRISGSVMLKYAAVILVTTAIGILLWTTKDVSSSKKIASAAILPASNRATLTLANGKKIELNGKKQGIIINQGVISYDDGSNIAASVANNPNQIVSLSTPKGGIYQIVLSDNSKVWLNASTTLWYPVKFTGQTRQVEVVGEAYFEVAENKSLPFIVKSKGQEIRVLGTAFNLAAFDEEKETRTTLVRGLVEISLPNEKKSSVTLYPAEEAKLNGKYLKKRKVDPEIAISWREGSFSFDDERLESIMNKIARWYDVEISYQHIEKRARYFGWVSRYDNLEVVLKRLEKAGGLHFKIEGRRILVTK